MCMVFAFVRLCALAVRTRVFICVIMGQMWLREFELSVTPGPVWTQCRFTHLRSVSNLQGLTHTRFMQAHKGNVNQEINQKYDSNTVSVQSMYHRQCAAKIKQYIKTFL